MPDAVIIGGGPGGGTAATLLTRRGYSVVLLEREIFPRAHVGESLLPASMPVLEELGVLGQIESENFPKKYGATMVWGRDDTPWSWYFRETNRTYPYAYQVSRPRFDQILLDNAKSSGVDVRENCNVFETLSDSESGAIHGVRYRRDSGIVESVEADFVMDASGQSALLARSMNLRTWDTFFQNLAVYGYYRGAKRLPSPDETNIFIESYGQGWTWTIPLKDGLASVGAIVDSESAQAMLADIGPDEFLRQQISQTARTNDMLSDAELTGAPRVVRDWSYTTNRMVGDGWILLGDAACFVDPLFSSGVNVCCDGGRLRPRSQDRPDLKSPCRAGLRTALPQGVRSLPRTCQPVLRQQPDGGVILLAGQAFARRHQCRRQGVIHPGGRGSASQRVRTVCAVSRRASV